MKRAQKIVLFSLLLWSLYHTIRDIFQDILGINHPLIDFLHVKPKHIPYFLGQYYKFWGLPLELGILLLSMRALKTEKFYREGFAAIVLFVIFVLFWAWSSF